MKRSARELHPCRVVRYTTSFLVLLLLAALCGCSTGRHRAYAGRARPKDQVALLVVPKQRIPGNPAFTGQRALLEIVSLDGGPKFSRSDTDGTVHIEILPGTHDVTVRLNGSEADLYGRMVVSSHAKVALKFDALASKTYFLVAEFKPEGWTAILREGGIYSGPIVAKPYKGEN